MLCRCDTSNYSQIFENEKINEVEENPTEETAEVVRLKLEFEREGRRLEREERRLEIEKFKKLTMPRKHYRMRNLR